MKNYTTAQVNTANEVLRHYVSEAIRFEHEEFQHGKWVFRAIMPHGTYFVIVGIRGAIIDNGWSA